MTETVERTSRITAQDKDGNKYELDIKVSCPKCKGVLLYNGPIRCDDCRTVYITRSNEKPVTITHIKSNQFRFRVAELVEVTVFLVVRPDGTLSNEFFSLGDAERYLDANGGGILLIGQEVE